MKEFLSQRGVDYIDRDIAEDQEAVAELGELGYMTTPVTVIDGEVVIGFDRARLEELLETKQSGSSPGAVDTYQGESNSE